MQIQMTTEKRKVLSSDEVRALCAEISEGAAAQLRLEGRRVPAAQAEALRRTIAAGEAAREHLIGSNFGLVYATASRHHSVRSGHAELDDVVQNGIVGLCRAADHFDPDRGVRFSTYATFWIRKAMNDGDRAADASPVFRSETARETRLLVLTQEELLGEKLGHAPTEEQVASALGKKVDDIRLLRHSTVAHLDGMNEADRSTTFATDDGERLLALEANMLVGHALEGLDPKERRSVELRFGFDGGGQRSFAEVGKLLGISEWTVKSRVDAALRRMRAEVGDAD